MRRWETNIKCNYRPTLRSSANDYDKYEFHHCLLIILTTHNHEKRELQKNKVGVFMSNVNKFRKNDPLKPCHGGS